MRSEKMIALLGLLAVAGYQNRDKLGDWLGRTTGQGSSSRDPAPVGDPALAGDREASTGSLGDLLGGLFGQDGAGGRIGDGLRDLVERFTGNGHGDEARSWLSREPNREIGPQALEEALGEDAIDALTRQTGLGREELLSRLSAVLPTAVDRMTPEGREPTPEEEAGWGARRLV